MKKLIKKMILLMTLLAGTGMVGAYAYFSDSVTVTNHIKTGDVNIGIQEYQMLGRKEVPYSNPKVVLPGDRVSKIPRITNYAMPCWIRVKIDYTEFPEEQTGITDANMIGLPDQWVKRGDYYYYTRILKKAESVDVFEGVSIPSEWGKAYEGQQFQITVQAEAIQAANFVPEFSAMSPWGNQTIELCIHEENGKVTCKKEDMDLSVVFRGEAHRLIAAPDDFFQNFGYLMPGDQFSDTVHISNTTQKEVELFFHVEADTKDEEQQKLLKEIGLEIKVNQKKFYSGNVKSVGLEKPLSLGCYQPGTSGEMEFRISVPKEWNNAYANRMADVNWIFTVNEEEKKTDMDPPETPSKEAATHWSDAENAESVKTGDETSVVIFFLLMGISGMFLCWNWFRKKGDHT